jgi:D-glycero-D-manno-heptose 1,7-bisphosphate phosphatase
VGRSAAVTLAKAVFFDRDGVLLKSFQDAETTRGPRRLSEMELLPDIIGPLTRIHDNRFIPLCITNQPDISRGLTTLREQEDINWWLKRNTGIYDAILCPHDDSDYCVCRKPQPGMVYWFAVLLQIDLLFHRYQWQRLAQYQKNPFLLSLRQGLKVSLYSSLINNMNHIVLLFIVF